MDIPLSSDALDLSFHPSDGTNLLAVGLISGKIQLINYDTYAASPSSSRPSASSKSISQSSSSAASEEEVVPKMYRKIWVSRPSKKPCRGLAFSGSGESVYSVSKDKAMFRVDTESGRVVDSWIGAHEAAPSRVLPVSDAMVVTGDDDGVVRLWDPRKGGGKGVKPVREWNHHFDWITDMVYLPDLPASKPKTKVEHRKSKSQLKKQRKRARLAAEEEEEEEGSEEENETTTSTTTSSGKATPSTSGGRSRLIVTSGDGSLSCIDLTCSGRSSYEQSEDQEDELLSITSVRTASSTKLIVGTQLGILSLWTPSRGLLDHVDRVPGHPASVDTLVTLDDETVLTGSSDGLVRVVQILPSKLLGVIASHAGLPVERMQRKQAVLASIGHSNAVKLTDLTPLLEDEEDDDDEERDERDAAIGITGLDAADTDDEDDDDEEEEELDFAGLANEPDEEESDQDPDSAEEEEEEEEEDDEEESSPAPPPTKKAKTQKNGKGGAFFSDM